MTLVQIITLALMVIQKLSPIALEVYQAVQDPRQPEATPETALALIQAKARAEGFQIGHTEAELVRSALHYALAKGARHGHLG